MAELIQQYVERIRGAGAQYIVRACGEQSPDGSWTGWLEFHDTDEAMPTLRSGFPTRHGDRGALTRWAAGLEKRDFDRAFRSAVAYTASSSALNRSGSAVGSRHA
jgi:hypothetical protein